MPATDVDLLREAALASGEIALKFFRDDPQTWDKADNAGPVTEADLAVNTYLTDMLRSARPEYGWLSEETEDTAHRLQTQRQFVVDPIDGTRSFIDGSKDWAHSIAVIENGRPVAAVVALPARDMVFHASLGGGAFLNGDPITVAPKRALNETTILSARPNLRPEYWKGAHRPDFRTAFRSSLAYRMCLAAQGRFDAMITFRPCWEWDIAAGALIVEEARGKAVDQTGLALRFNNKHPQTAGALAGASSAINQLLDAMV